MSVATAVRIPESWNRKHALIGENIVDTEHGGEFSKCHIYYKIIQDCNDPSRNFSATRLQSLCVLTRLVLNDSTSSYDSRHIGPESVLCLSRKTSQVAQESRDGQSSRRFYSSRSRSNHINSHSSTCRSSDF